MRSLAAFVSLTLVAASSAWAQSFVVRRATNPAAAGTAPVHATTQSAPFKDAPGTLDDGASYYYLVEDSTSQPLDISVSRDLASRTVQIGFDDGDPSSADVDVDLSTVVALPASIPADGVSRATLVIVPRDSSGTPLGTGLDVKVDVAALWPGFAAGQVVDRGNGEYQLSVRSWTVGAGTAVVTVEGLVLAATPQLNYTTPAVPSGPVAELLQIAAELQALIDAGADQDVADELVESIEEILKAVADLQKSPPDIERAVDRIKHADHHLVHALDFGFDVATADFYTTWLTAIAREFAVQAIDTAIVGGGDPAKIQEALNKFALAEALAASGNHEDAAQKYKEAIGKAQEALS